MTYPQTVSSVPTTSYPNDHLRAAMPPDGEALLRLATPPSEVPVQNVVSAQLPIEEYDFLAYYGLRENPFTDSVNPIFFYKTKVHEEAVIRTMVAIRNHISLALVAGQSGTGKTLVSQLVMQNLDPARFQPVLVLVSPGMSKSALLVQILNELGLPIPEGHFVRTQDLLKILGDHVIELHYRQKKLVILIDECHFLSGDCLHMLRTISNIELPERKLTTCVLFAEDRLLKRLDHPGYESLRNRIYFRSRLLPLEAGDCMQYVKFRLLMAGRAEPLFEESALNAIHECSEGVCRRINKLGMLALLEGMLQHKPMLDRALVVSCADQL